MTTALLLTGHGLFSQGLYSSLKMVMGVNENIKYQNFIEGESSENLKKNLKNLIADLLKTNDRLICLTDIKGGTPFRLCCELAIENPKISVVSGANMPLLFQLTELMEEDFNLGDTINESLKDIFLFKYVARKEVEEIDGI